MNWQLSIQGSRDNAKFDLSKDSTASADVKSAIAAQIDSLPQNFTSIQLSAFSNDITSQVSPGRMKREIHISISAS